MLKVFVFRYWISGLLAIVLLAACSALRPADSGIPKPRKPRSRTSTGSSKSPAAVSSLRQGITRTARKYKGSKYKYGGTTPKGFDCSGFTSYVLLKHKIDLHRTSDQQARQGKKIKPKSALPGDLLFFGKKGKVAHVAIVTKNSGNQLKVIHSTSSKGVVEQDITHSDYWQSRLLFARRVF